MSYRTDKLRLPAKHLVKEMVWAGAESGRRRALQPDLCIYSSRRGGSTLLMEALASQPGVSFVDQPFSPFTASRDTLARIPIGDGGQIVAVDGDEAALLHAYISDLLAHRHVTNAPWKAHRRPDQLRPIRTVLKITDAKALAPWIHERFFVETIVLFRHPVAQARSVVRNGWQRTGWALWRNADYWQRFLDPQAGAEARARYETGSDFERAVADWCLENLPLLAERHRGDWTVLHHEDLVRQPERIADRLAGRLGLPDPDEIARVLQAPSRSTKRSSTAQDRETIRSGAAEELLTSAIERCSAAELASAQELLDLFRVSVYRADSPLPVHEAVEEGQR